MRHPHSHQQQRFDCASPEDLVLNLNCRDEIIPILFALKYLYSQSELRDLILDLVAQDVNENTRSDLGREGLDYWSIIVLAAVRLGCNFDYDKLQDLAEQHRSLRRIMGIGDWQEQVELSSRTIQDNISLLKPATLEAISHAIVEEAYRLNPEAAEKQRADSFVVETNIHYPTESSLIADGLRKVIELCLVLCGIYGLSGWRQHAHLLGRIKQITRRIDRISSKKGPGYKKKLEEQYRRLLKLSKRILARADETCEDLISSCALKDSEVSQVAEIKVFIERTRQVCGTARRRVLEGETVPNEDKLFSIFEPHTQLYKRGKAGQEMQFGRLVLIFEDAAGFIPHHYVMPRDVQDEDVAISETRKLQARLGGRVKSISFDRGFHSPENQEELPKVVPEICVPKPGAQQSVKQMETASVTFHESKQRHPGVESAIGALQSGNGMTRCRDVGEVGFERYVALAVLGRNIHSLGKLLIARANPTAAAGMSYRKAG